MINLISYSWRKWHYLSSNLASFESSKSSSCESSPELSPCESSPESSFESSFESSIFSTYIWNQQKSKNEISVLIIFDKSESNSGFQAYGICR